MTKTKNFTTQTLADSYLSDTVPQPESLDMTLTEIINALSDTIKYELDAYGIKSAVVIGYPRNAEYRPEQCTTTEGYECSAGGFISHADGYATTTIGQCSHAEGNRTSAAGTAAHAEGAATYAGSDASHSEGLYSQSNGAYSHAEGYVAIAKGKASHAEGYGVSASADFSHAEGSFTSTQLCASAHAEGVGSIARGYGSHAEGLSSIANGQSSHAEGLLAITGSRDRMGPMGNGIFAHAEGVETSAIGYGSHAEGLSSIADGWHAHAEGKQTTAKLSASHAEGCQTSALSNYAHAEGNSTKAEGQNSHAEGVYTIASGNNSHAEGTETAASGRSSHAEGWQTTAFGNRSHAEGESTAAASYASHAEGAYAKAQGEHSHAEGEYTVAAGKASHAEGFQTFASGTGAHSEGSSTSAEGGYSHAEGYWTTASGESSHAEGISTVVSAKNSHVDGFYAQATKANAYVWNGDTSLSSKKRYSDHGIGTYNLNPNGGASALYIGEQSLCAIISTGDKSIADQLRAASCLLSSDLTSFSGSLSGYYMKTETSSASQISTALSSIDAVSVAVSSLDKEVSTIDSSVTSAWGKISSIENKYDDEYDELYDKYYNNLSPNVATLFGQTKYLSAQTDSVRNGLTSLSYDVQKLRPSNRYAFQTVESLTNPKVKFTVGIDIWKDYLHGMSISVWFGDQYGELNFSCPEDLPTGPVDFLTTRIENDQMTLTYCGVETSIVYGSLIDITLEMQVKECYDTSIQIWALGDGVTVEDPTAFYEGCWHVKVRNGEYLWVKGAPEAAGIAGVALSALAVDPAPVVASINANPAQLTSFATSTQLEAVKSSLSDYATSAQVEEVKNALPGNATTSTYGLVKLGQASIDASDPALVGIVSGTNGQLGVSLATPQRCGASKICTSIRQSTASTGWSALSQKNELVILQPEKNSHPGVVSPSIWVAPANNVALDTCIAGNQAVLKAYAPIASADTYGLVKLATTADAEETNALTLSALADCNTKTFKDPLSAVDYLADDSSNAQIVAAVNAILSAMKTL